MTWDEDSGTVSRAFDDWKEVRAMPPQRWRASYTILIDGEECHAGSPWDSTYYYKD